jgi:hypothetical protein
LFLLIFYCSKTRAGETRRNQKHLLGARNNPKKARRKKIIETPGISFTREILRQCFPPRLLAYSLGFKSRKRKPSRRLGSGKIAFP